MDNNVSAAGPLALSFVGTDLGVLTLSGDLTKAVLDPLKIATNLAAGQIKETASQNAGGKINILLDMSGFTGVYDAEDLQIMSDFAKGNAPYVAKTAVFGGPETGSMAAEVAAALAGRENIQTFATKVEAELWLAL